MTTQQQGPPAGWYPDPGAPQMVRYWNGATYTNHIAPMPRTGVSDAVETIGWVCAFLFPIVGFAIGCILLSEGRKHDGWWMTLVSAGFGLAGLALLVTSATTTA